MPFSATNQMTASKANSKLANAAPDGKDFQPRVGLANPHLQTLWGGLVRRDDKLAEPEAMRVRVTPEAEIICHCNWQPEPRERVTVIVVHGLEGSSRSGHVIGVANKAFAAGMNVVRMNMRNCGGTEALTPTLYHSGLGCDIAAVVAHLHESRQLERITVIGYSAGGNMTMNMLGEYANAPHPALKACAVISPAMDPEKTAYMLDEPQNYLYRRNFLQSLTRLYRRKMELYPERYPASVLKRYTSIVEFDDMISGPFSGFNGAKGLYDGICSKRFAEKVR